LKRFLVFVCFILLGDALLAQAPHLFSFQSVIRDKDELLVTNKEVVMRFSINQYDSLGATVFSEYHYVFTNSNGLMTAQIGSGENIIGSLEEINWGDGDFYAMYEVDFDDQTGWDMKAYTQLMSVPYALYAKYAESGTDADSTNEIQQIFIENDFIYITSGDTGISLSKYLDNTDDQIISISEDTIYLEDGGSIVLPELPPEVDMDSTNEIQILSLSGDTLYLTMGGTVDLSTYLDNTDDQLLSLINDTLSLEDGGTVSLVTYLDNTDDQLLSISNDTISLEDGGSVVLPPLPPEVDMDSTNELQIISLSGDTLYLSNGGYVILSSYLDNTDDQTISYNQQNSELSIEDGNTVDLSTLLDNTDNQQISISNDTITLENGGSVVLDVDLDSTNELQSVSITNDTLFISNSNSVSLTSYLDNTDDQQISISNDTITLEDGGSVVLPSLPPQVDLDSTNEIQIISISNDTLILSNGGTVSLTNYLDNTDDQVLTISGDTLFLEDGGSVILPYDVDSLFSDELQQLQISGTGIVKNLTITDGNMIQFSVADNDNDSTNELQGLGEVLAIDSNAGGHNIVNIKSISIGMDTVDTNIALNVKSSSSGVVFSRMTKQQRISINNPVEGLIVTQIDEKKGLYIYMNGKWTRFKSFGYGDPNNTLIYTTNGF
jgi:hypothetical protein